MPNHIRRQLNGRLALLASLNRRSGRSLAKGGLWRKVKKTEKSVSGSEEKTDLSQAVSSVL